MLSKPNLIAAAAGVGVSLFVGYCFYFDYKRRSAPDFKARLLAKRKKEKVSRTEIVFPDVKNPSVMQEFFFSELKLGEDLLNQGNISEGVKHLGVAIMLTGQASQLLKMMETSLPPATFQRLVNELPKARERVRQAFVKQQVINPSLSSNMPSVLEELE